MNQFDWTAEENQAFAEIMAVSRLNRIQAIQLWKRFKRNTLKAVAVARKQYPRISQAVIENMAKARLAKQRIKTPTFQTQTPTVSTQSKPSW